MATWHQEQNRGALAALFAADPVKWKCVSGDQRWDFAGCMKFDTEADAVAYSNRTGDRIIPPMQTREP